MGYGSVVLQNSAGGYILIGLGAFLLGTAVTLFCLRIRQKQLLSEKRNRANINDRWKKENSNADRTGTDGIDS